MNRLLYALALAPITMAAYAPPLSAYSDDWKPVGQRTLNQEAKNENRWLLAPGYVVSAATVNAGEQRGEIGICREQDLYEGQSCTYADRAKFYRTIPVSLRNGQREGTWHSPYGTYKLEAVQIFSNSIVVRVERWGSE